MVANIGFGQPLVTGPEERAKLFSAPQSPVPVPDPRLPFLPLLPPLVPEPHPPFLPLVPPLGGEAPLQLSAAQAQAQAPLAPQAAQAQAPTAAPTNDVAVVQNAEQAFNNIWRTVPAGQTQTLYQIAQQRAPTQMAQLASAFESAKRAAASGGLQLNRDVQMLPNFWSAVVGAAGLAELMAVDPAASQAANALTSALAAVTRAEQGTRVSYSGIEVSADTMPPAAQAPQAAAGAPAPGQETFAPKAAAEKVETPGEKLIREATEAARLKFITAAPIQLTGPFTETPLGQALTNLFGRGGIPTLEEMRLMAEAESARLQQEEQRLMNEAAREVQSGNLEIAQQNAENARALATRRQELDELIEPFRAGTERLGVVGELAQSPLVGFFTARGQAPPAYLQNILNAPISPNQTNGGSVGQIEPAPFVKSLAAGMQLPSFSATPEGAPQFPSAAQWHAMTPGEQEGTIQLFEQTGIPRADFLAMLERSFPPGGGGGAATFVSPVA